MAISKWNYQKCFTISLLLYNSPRQPPFHPPPPADDVAGQHKGAKKGVVGRSVAWKIDSIGLSGCEIILRAL